MSDLKIATSISPMNLSMNKPQKQNIFVSILLCFSAHSNLKNLFTTKSQDELPAIRGFKVFTMIWIVIANVFLLGQQTQIKNLISKLISV